MTALLILSVTRCSHYKTRGDSNACALSDTILHYTNSVGTQTASIKTLQVDNRMLKALVFDKDAELAKLAKEFAQIKNIVKHTTITKYDTINVAFTDTIPCVFSRAGAIKKDWYSFTYKATQKGFVIDSLSIPNAATIITGTKRKWFFGQEVVNTDITNSNPHYCY